MKEREAGLGRPVHVRNGFLVKNDGFMYFQKFSEIIIKDFSALLLSPICDRRKSSFRSRPRRDAPYDVSLRSQLLSTFTSTYDTRRYEQTVDS